MTPGSSDMMFAKSRRIWEAALAKSMQSRVADLKPDDVSDDEWEAGVKHEAEHKKSVPTKVGQAKIAADHLEEDPHYYSKLKKIEKALTVDEDWHHDGSEPHETNKLMRTVRHGETIGSYQVRPMSSRDNTFYVDDVQAVTRGGGRLVMEHLTSKADAHGASLYLIAEPVAPKGEGVGMKPHKLSKWYKRFGFENDWSVSPRYGIRLTREPKRQKNDLGLPPLNKSFQLVPEHEWNEMSTTDDPDDHYYHITSAPAAARILEEGLRPSKGRKIAGNGPYAVHSAGKVFLTERPGVSFWTGKIEDHLFDQHDDPPAVAVLRIPKHAVGSLENDPVGSEDARHPAYMSSEMVGVPVRKSAAEEDDLGLPPMPGTAPIPEGHIRLFHQTSSANLDGIRKEGLHIKHAKGIEGPKAIYADESGFYGKPGDIPTVEFHVPANKFRSPFVLAEHVPSEQIVAIHEPWHHTARYLSEDKNSRAREATVRGDYDYMLDDPNHARAINHIKARYGNLEKAQFFQRLIHYVGTLGGNAGARAKDSQATDPKVNVTAMNDGKVARITSGPVKMSQVPDAKKGKLRREVSVLEPKAGEKFIDTDTTKYTWMNDGRVSRVQMFVKAEILAALERLRKAA